MKKTFSLFKFATKTTTALRFSSVMARSFAAPSRIWRTAGILSTVGLTTTLFSQKQLTYTFIQAAQVNLDSIKKDIVAIMDKDPDIGPTFVRLAWHASGTYSKSDQTGGSNGGTIRLEPEAKWGANAGLHIVRDLLEPIKKKNPNISYADLYIYAGVVAIEEMKGPKLPFRLGRSDHTGPSSPLPASGGRLPDADKGEPKKTIQHVRDIFYRMGFNDQEIVALAGAHALGRCHTDRSGYDGPWTNSPTMFTNDYFVQLLNNKWTLRNWKGPQQYEDPSKTLMMLPADIAFIQDPAFKKWVEVYAKDEDKFFADFSKAFTKLTELGCKFN